VTLNILFLGLACSAVASWLYVATIGHLGGSRASIFINLMPVVAVLAAFFILGERLGALQWVGGAAAIAGVYLATVSGHLKGASQEAAEPSRP